MFPLRGGLAPLTLASSIPVIPWYLSGGIAAANCVAVYKPKGALSLADSYTNLANSGTYNAAPGTAPTWDATNGWTGGGNAYLTTGVTPTSSWTTLIRFSNSSVINQYPFGSYKTTGTVIYATLPRDGNGRRAYWNGTSQLLIASGAVASGVMCVAGNKAYYNGVEDGTILNQADTGLAMYILALNNNNSPLLYYTGSVQAFATYNTTLTAAQVLAVTNAMNAL